MTKITSFNRNNLDPVSDDMMTELRKVGEKYGLDFSRKGIRYTEGDFRVTVVATVRDKAKGVMTKEEANYNINSVGYNLPSLGYTYRASNGMLLTVVGWNTRARKYPIMLKDENGGGRKCSIRNLKVVFNNEG